MGLNCSPGRAFFCNLYPQVWCTPFWTARNIPPPLTFSMPHLPTLWPLLFAGAFSGPQWGTNRRTGEPVPFLWEQPSSNGWEMLVEGCQLPVLWSGVPCARLCPPGLWGMKSHCHHGDLLIKAPPFCWLLPFPWLSSSQSPDVLWVRWWWGSHTPISVYEQGWSRWALLILGSHFPLYVMEMKSWLRCTSQLVSSDTGHSSSFYHILIYWVGLHRWLSWLSTLSAVQETQVQSLGQEGPLEKEMATHSSILAWQIPWTKKPGGLQSMGSQRVEHDWVTKPPPRVF